MTLLDSGKGLEWGYLNHGKSQYAVEAKKSSIKRISHSGTLRRDAMEGRWFKYNLTFKAGGSRIGAYAETSET
jgi:hypothetical protein